MKALVLTLFVLITCAANAQHLTYREWQEQSFRDMRLMPEYGNRPKNAEMMASDSDFVAQTLQAIPDRRKASDALVLHGFDLLSKGDMVSSMFRFNQAFLVDPKNPLIHRGYGAFFVALDRNTEAAKEYQKGLALDSTNTALMTDMANVFLAEHYNLKADEPEKSAQLLDGATGLLIHALEQEPGNAEANFKLSACYLNKKECESAWTYFQKSVQLGSPSADETYRAQLMRACPK